MSCSGLLSARRPEMPKYVDARSRRIATFVRLNARLTWADASSRRTRASWALSNAGLFAPRVSPAGRMTSIQPSLGEIWNDPIRNAKRTNLAAHNLTEDPQAVTMESPAKQPGRS